MKFWQKAVICVAATEVLGNASGLVTFLSIDDWYRQLERPAGTPPNSVFGPVWLTLYAMMGYALALVWDRVSDIHTRNRAMRWFGVQFALNLAWTPAFFGVHQIGLAMLCILMLWGAIIITINLFLKVRRPAAFLLIPYLIWVSYAAYLNAGFWALNRA
ncbi:MAG: TspO/MBR family protein [Verrucomicrobiota bacterium]